LTVLLMAIVLGGLFAGGLYLMLARSITRVLLGLVLIGHATNLLIFTAGGLVRGRPPLVPAGPPEPAAGYADPLPQALILTAIVISFALTAFTAVLVRATYQATGTEDSDDLRSTDT
jgi:multicomponent Na+:H+ antiporter subunit C